MPNRYIPKTFMYLLDVLCVLGSVGWTWTIWPELRELALSSPRISEWFRPAAEIGIAPGFGQQVALLATFTSPMLVVMEFIGGYQPLTKIPRTRIVLNSGLAAFLGLSVVTLVLFALKIDTLSRLFMFALAMHSAIFSFGYRLALRSYFLSRARQGAYARPVVVIGSPLGITRIAEHYERVVPTTSRRLVGYLAVHPDDPNAFLDQNESQFLPRLGSVGDLGNLFIHQPIQEVVAVLGATDANWIRQVIQVCAEFRVTLRIVPEPLIVMRWRDADILFASDEIRMPEIVVRNPQTDSDGVFIKRLLDIVVSFTLLVLLAPVFALIALGIKLSTPNLPIFYHWNVVGYQGKRFRGYKFTTMQADADQRKADLMHLNEMSGPVFKIKHDPRITTFGRFLRKFSLNELPQLWSVLKGDMSLVGPRPAGPHEIGGYELWHKRKLSIRPGITCLWQVRGRNAISNFDDWVRMDLEYIDNWSLWLDLKILLRTAWVVVRGTGS